MEEQTGARLPAVFGPKRAEMHGIGKSRPSGRLDLDGQELPSLLDDELDFLGALQP